MKLLRTLFVAASALLVAAAQAHFVWANFRDVKSREVVVTFAEVPGDSVLSIMNKVGGRIAVQSKGASKGRTTVPTETTYHWKGTKGVFLGSLDYGVVDHGQGPYMLTYWFKAVSRPIQAAKAVGKGLEIVADQHADHWEVKVLMDGKPCPNAQVVWGSGEAEQKEPASKPVNIPVPGAPKELPVRAVLEQKTPGTFEGKAYPSKKIWSTLVLPAVGQAPKGADESAYLALQNATMGRETIGHAAPFSCSFRATNGDQTATGTVSVDDQDKITVKVDGVQEEGSKHVTQQITSLFSHRLGREFWKGEGQYSLTWSPKDSGLLSVNDKMQSFYRFDQQGIKMVQRTFGPNILVLDIKSSIETPWGGLLSKEYSATQKRVSDGVVTSRLNYKDDFLPFQDEWMPKSRTVTGDVEGRKITMSVTFFDYKLGS
ncbi:MAG: DUF3386 family protein [Armatimonadetes bacterium]|nr:DUF3386 family protein [Armatimonadota bacterium]